MKPEQRVAARVLQKYALSVPTDVETLAKALANVEQDVLPVNSDAVVITAGLSGCKPLIILNKNTPHTRRRFTLAHELGHLLIPFACHLTAGIRLGDHLYMTTEAESNRFASELLLPSNWLKNIVASGMSAGQMLHFVRSSAQVSTAAATLGLCQALPAGYLFAITDGNGFVTMTGISPGSYLNPPAKGHYLDVSNYSHRATKYETVTGAQAEQVHWWRYGAPPQSAGEHSDARSSSEILNSIITSIAFTSEQIRFFTQSINGIIGAANSSRRPGTALALLDVLYETFATRPKLSQITSHPDFDVFLQKRANEIVSRRPT